LGLLTFLDPPRPDTKDTIHKAIAYGVGVKMITGDHRLIAQETARQLDMGDDVRNVDGKMGRDSEIVIERERERVSESIEHKFF